MRVLVLLIAVTSLASAIHLRKDQVQDGPFDNLWSKASKVASRVIGGKDTKAGALANDLVNYAPYAAQGVKHTFEHMVLGLNTTKKVTEKELPPQDHPDKMKYHAVQVSPISVPDAFRNTNIVLVGDSNDREAARWLCENLAPEKSNFRFHHHFARSTPVEKEDAGVTWNARNTHGIAMCDLPRHGVSVVSFFHFGVFLNDTSGSPWNDWALSMIPQPLGEEKLPLATVDFVKELDAKISAQVFAKATETRGDDSKQSQPRRTLVLTNSHMWDVIPALFKGSQADKKVFKAEWFSRAEGLMKSTMSTFSSADEFTKAPLAFAWRTQAKCPLWVKDTQAELENMAQQVRDAHTQQDSVFSKVALVDWRKDESIDRKNEGEKCYNAFPELSPTSPVLAEKDKLAIHMKSYSQFWRSVFEHEYDWHSKE